jgi:hypothetical protein
MAVANTKCQAKNPLACRDPHCPEKRYNLKYTLTLLEESQEKIKQSKKDKTFVGQHKEELELNQQSIINWHNELLAESKIDGKKAEEYITTVKAKYEAVKLEKEELENQLSTSDMEANIPIVKEIEKVDARLKEIQAEFPDAYRSFYATWEGQQHLLKKLAHYKKTSPNRKAEIANIKKQIIERQYLNSIF